MISCTKLALSVTGKKCLGLKLLLCPGKKLIYSNFISGEGFSRETSTYIKRHRDQYVIKTETGEIKLRRSLGDCGNISVSKEVADVMYNIPELFVDDDEPDFSILF
jgi:hypothetical protein